MQTKMNEKYRSYDEVVELQADVIELQEVTLFEKNPLKMPITATETKTNQNEDAQNEDRPMNVERYER